MATDVQVGILSNKLFCNFSQQFKDTVKQIIEMDPAIDQIEETIETLRIQRQQNGDNNVEVGT